MPSSRTNSGRHGDRPSLGLNSQGRGSSNILDSFARFWNVGCGISPSCPFPAVISIALQAGSHREESFIDISMPSAILRLGLSRLFCPLNGVPRCKSAVPAPWTRKAPFSSREKANNCLKLQFFVEPFHRMFFINDLRISFPYAEVERVPLS